MKKQVQVLLAKEETKERDEAKKAAVEEADKKLAYDDATSRAERFLSYLDEAKSVDGLLERFCVLLKEITGATSVYMGELRNDQFDASGADLNMMREPSLDYLKYVAVSEAKSNMLSQRLNNGEGVTHELFTPEEEEPEPEVQYDEDGNMLPPPPKPEKPMRTVFIANVLGGGHAENIKFFELPKTGCYLGVRVEFDSCLHDLAFDETEARLQQLAEIEAREEEEKAREDELRKEQEAEMEEARQRQREEEDEYLSPEERAARDEQEAKARTEKELAKHRMDLETEEEKEARLAKEAEEKRKRDETKLISLLPKRQVRYALCLDTLGQTRRFTDAEVQLATKFAKKLQETLLRIDTETYKAERKARAMIAEVASTVEEKSEDDRRDEIAQLIEEYRRSGEAVSAEDAAFQHRQGTLLRLRQQVLELRSYNVLRGPIAVLQAALYLFETPQTLVADSDNRAEWPKVRALLNDDFLRKLEDYKPREAFAKKLEARAVAEAKAQAEGRKLKKGLEEKDNVHSTASIAALISTIDYEDLRARNYVLAELFGFVTEAIQVLRLAELEDKRAKAKEKARVAREKAEAEAEAARQKEEAEAEAHERAQRGIIEEADEGDD